MNGHDCEPRTCAWIDEQRNDDVLDAGDQRERPSVVETWRHAGSHAADRRPGPGQVPMWHLRDAGLPTTLSWSAGITESVIQETSANNDISLSGYYDGTMRVPSVRSQTNTRSL